MRNVLAMIGLSTEFLPGCDPVFATVNFQLEDGIKDVPREAKVRACCKFTTPRHLIPLLAGERGVVRSRIYQDCLIPHPWVGLEEPWIPRPIKFKGRFRVIDGLTQFLGLSLGGLPNEDGLVSEEEFPAPWG